MVAPLFVKIAGSQFAIRFMTEEHVKRNDDEGMGDGHDRPFSPATGGQALIQGRRVRPFRPRSRMGQWRQAGAQGALAPEGLARALFAGALIGTMCLAGPG
jgi:hypothetical protein